MVDLTWGTTVNKQIRQENKERDDRHGGCPWTLVAFAPLETSEVISGTIIQAIDEWPTMINVTPSLHVPWLGHRGLQYQCPPNTQLAKVLWTSHLLFCCFIMSDLHWALYYITSDWFPVFTYFTSFDFIHGWSDYYPTYTVEQPPFSRYCEKRQIGTMFSGS